MILFFDVETTGFYLSKIPYGHSDQPSLVQIAAILTDDTGGPVMSVSLVVNPEKDVPQQAANIHGITTEVAKKTGVSLRAALGVYRHFASLAGVIVAHNAEFDLNVMRCVAANLKQPDPMEGRLAICTMKVAADIIDLPPTDRMVAAGFNKPKSPKLEECIKHFFQEELSGAHDALVDVQACARVFWHLKSLGALND